MGNYEKRCSACSAILHYPTELKKRLCATCQSLLLDLICTHALQRAVRLLRFERGDDLHFENNDFTRAADGFWNSRKNGKIVELQGMDDKRMREWLIRYNLMLNVEAEGRCAIEELLKK